MSAVTTEPGFEISDQANDVGQSNTVNVAGRITSRRLDAEVVARLQKAFDCVIIFTIGMLTYVEIAGVWDAYEMLRGIGISFLGTFVFLVIARELQAYKIQQLKSARSQIARSILACFVVAIVAGISALFTGMATPWASAWVGAWLAATLALLSTERFALSLVLKRLSLAGRLARRVALVGDGQSIEEAIERLKANGPEEVDICGFFDDRDADRSGDLVSGVPKLGDIDDLIEFSRWFRIDTIIVTIPLTAEDRLLHLLRQLWEIPADIRISALGSKLRLNRRAYSKIGDLPLLDTFDRPISSWDQLVKSTFDKVVAAIAIVAFSPIMLATAIAVRWESPGPALFRQRRYGFNNELVEIYKFRSMKAESSDADASKLVTRDDDRVTRVGKFIRKTSIDELPQLFNVLTGDLSLVGPRPHAIKAKAADQLYDAVVHDYLARHRVKPGVTGWAQIKGWRGETDTTEKIERRVECDLYYIDHWSIWLDIYILAATPLALFNTKQAF